MLSAALVFNPLAGKGRLRSIVPAVIENLRRSGYDAVAVPTRGPGDAEARARDAVAGDAEVVFALGGDGTLRECACGILGSGACLAFLPSGTMNVMALEFAIPARPVAAARSYATAREVHLGVGLAGESPFLMQVSAGVDAFLIGSLRSREKRMLGRAAVVPAILRSLARYSFPPFEVRTDAGSQRGTLAVASNILRYGGPFQLTPGARSDGSSLELFVFSGRGRSAAIAFALSLLVGRHLRLAASSVTTVRAATFVAGARVPFQIDGDVLAIAPGRPLAVSLSSETLRFLAPAASVASRSRKAGTEAKR